MTRGFTPTYEPFICFRIASINNGRDSLVESSTNTLVLSRSITKDHSTANIDATMSISCSDNQHEQQLHQERHLPASMSMNPCSHVLQLTSVRVANAMANHPIAKDPANCRNNSGPTSSCDLAERLISKYGCDCSGSARNRSTSI